MSYIPAGKTHTFSPLIPQRQGLLLMNSDKELQGSGGRIFRWGWPLAFDLRSSLTHSYRHLLKSSSSSPRTAAGCPSTVKLPKISCSSLMWFCQAPLYQFAVSSRIVRHSGSSRFNVQPIEVSLLKWFVFFIYTKPSRLSHKDFLGFSFCAAFVVIVLVWLIFIKINFW